MTQVHLIRHGRASAEKQDYDQLHPLGIRQSELLGAHLAARAQGFDAVYCGPLLRQRDTLGHMRRAAGAHARAWPDEIILDGLAEAPFDQMVKRGLLPLMAQDPQLVVLVEGLQAASGDEAAKQAQMLRIFHHMALLWLRGQWNVDGIEDVDSFKRRVLVTLDQITAAHRDAEHVAVVTSNGVIGCIVDHLRGTDVHAQDYAVPALSNASMTRLSLDASGELRVAETDHTPHLDDPALRTLL